MHPIRINNSYKRANRRTIHAGSQTVGEVRNQQLSHSLMTGLQMDEHIARIALNQGATPQVKTYLTDALGSVIATAKADQSLEVGYAFSPYGQTQKVGVEGQQPGSENSSQYTGRENDNNGLYFYRARYYDPMLKRFISEDPIGLRGGINAHAYVEGNPVSFTDPEGLRGGGFSPPTTMLRPQPLPGFTPSPGYQPAPVYRPPGNGGASNTNGRGEVMDNVADIIGGVTGGSNRINHPELAPNMTFPERPNTGGQCTMVCSPTGGNSCRANDGCRIVCGPIASQGRGR